MGERLSKAQRELLVQLVQPAAVATHYRPAKVLVDQGLCEWREVGLSTLLVRTEAGERMAAKCRPQPEGEADV